jgi:hypothetical protein
MTPRPVRPVCPLLNPHQTTSTRHDVGEGMAVAAPGQVRPRAPGRLGAGCSPAGGHRLAVYQAMCAMTIRGHAS